MFTLVFFRSQLREILSHKLLALRAIAVGWASLLLLASVAAPKLAELDFYEVELASIDAEFFAVADSRGCARRHPRPHINVPRARRPSACTTFYDR